MAKIKFTKGELKRQRDALSQFRHYLPTLQLKKQQLQIKILEARKVLEEKENSLKGKEKSIDDWIGVLVEAPEDFSSWIIPEDILIEETNVAGANISLFKKVRFKEAEYDLFMTPFWVDEAVEQLRLVSTLIVEIELVKKQIATLGRELRITTQRVNLFEKVKIPDCLENIRRIRIYLGDQQSNAVGIGKVAKKKVEAKELAAA